MRRSVVVIVAGVLVAFAQGEARCPSAFDPAAAMRGRAALTGKSYSPAIWSMNAYAKAWKRWPGVKTKPDDYDAAFRDHYGMHAAPFPNNGLPMGLREGQRLMLGKGLSMDCMVCHGGSICGQSYIGLGNSTLE